jgi:hypothetical protein
MRKIKSNILYGAVLLLASCGGGNSDIPKMEGVFVGSFSDGVLLNTVVLGDGTFWAAYGDESDDGINFSGLIKGKADSKDGKFNIPSFTNFNKPGNKITSGTGTGTYSVSSIAGSITQEGNTSTFKVSEPPRSQYVYRQKASLTAIAGPWSGQLLDGDTSSIDIGADGIFSGTSSGGCAFTGKFAPRSDDVNVFDVSVTFGGAPCPTPNESGTGIGLNTLSDGGKSNLFVGLITASLKVGTIFYAQR